MAEARTLGASRDYPAGAARLPTPAEALAEIERQRFVFGGKKLLSDADYIAKLRVERNALRGVLREIANNTMSREQMVELARVALGADL